MTPEHRAAKAAFKKARGMDVFGPFLPLLWSPELMLRASAVGDYLRYQSAFPPQLSEFVILVTSRLWSQQYEWSLHRPIALQAGIDGDIVDAIAEGRRPQPMSAEQEILYDFVTELIRGGTVSDSAYERLFARFGERGVMDATGIVGYYTLLAMVLNTARTPPEPGTPPLPVLPP
jgi:4-carboxymuconolactone decarboxylase